MDMVHLAIGVTSVVAMIVIMANSVSYVGGRVADKTGGNVSDIVTRGSPVADQLTAVEGEPPLVEGEYINATCSTVQSITSTACTFVGPFLPRLPSLRDLNEEEKDAGTKREAEPDEDALAWKDPPTEEATEEV
ncbi:hypothetical protein KR054_004963 [Drosophila jambulina]|nr:hypothetical protein KR054_004963 [Drosophila jambulina]